MKHLTRTKIVATIGPVTESVPMLEKMIHAGMRVARLNFSHGSYESHAKLVKNIRTASRNVGVEVAILQDLQGPRIRVGDLPVEGVPVTKSSSVALVGERRHRLAIPGHITVPIQYDELYRDVKSGTVILIEDGTIQLKVVAVRQQVIYCKVLVPGTIKTHKGINVPGVTLTVDVITDKDKSDIAFGQKQEVDFVALSFVREAKDIKRVHELIKKNQKKGTTVATKVIAKIERREALENLDSIIAVSDGIMVARGDLGLEIAAQEVPLWQKEMIQRCLAAAKPVIVATQMLDSMIRNPQPTRAEVSDVANAVIDHTDAVMLSGESATGKYPLEAVHMMSKIAAVTEASGYDTMLCGPFDIHDRRTAMALAVCEMTKHVNAKAVIVATRLGQSVRAISRHRPELPVLALTPEKKTVRQLALSWGVIAHAVPAKADLKKIIQTGVKFLKDHGLAGQGDMIVVVGAHPFESIQESNTLRLIRIGEPY